MVVSSVLMSMGMMMLPPTTISLPFKILLFILAGGWDLSDRKPCKNVLLVESEVMRYDNRGTGS